MKYDVTIVGGGIVGLATAYQLLRKKPNLKLLLLEKEDALSKHQTGHNSGVIHSGLYYKPGSLKALNCLKGYEMLLQFCEEENIQYDICGKIVVATSNEEIPYLENLYNRGIENGLKGIEFIEPDEINDLEPYINGVKGIKVPQTGIIDYLDVSKKLGEKIKTLGGDIRLNHKVIKINNKNGLAEIATNKESFESRLIINCAGLYSDKVAQLSEDKKIDLRIIPFRGEYYKLIPEKEYLINNLVYPVPDPNFPFLGVHFTRMIKGGIEAGPNAVLAFKREGYKKYDVDMSELYETLSWPGFQKVASKYWQTGLGEMQRSFSKAAFTKALKKLLPSVEEKDLVSAEAGVRAQACDINGGLLDDFRIIENSIAINVCNAPSPAATSSLSIGDTVSDMAINRLEY